jgi:hypothetical protein
MSFQPNFLIFKKQKKTYEISLQSVYVPLTFLGNGSVNTFLRQWIHTQHWKNCWTRCFLCGPCFNCFLISYFPTKIHSEICTTPILVREWNIVMDPHGALNQEWLCWRGPAAICPTDRLHFCYVLYRPALPVWEFLAIYALRSLFSLPFCCIHVYLMQMFESY